MKISVVIPTLDRSEDLRVTLESFLKQESAPSEVVVIDQSAAEDTARLCESFEGRFRAIGCSLMYVHSSEKSSARARNVGLARVTGDIVSFMDDDIRLFPDYFEKIAAYFRSHPDVGGVAGNVLIDKPYSGWKWVCRKAFERFFLISHFDGRLTASGFGFPVWERSITREMNVQCLPGCNMNFRLETVKGIQFDPWFTGYSYREDVDFSYQVFRRAPLRMIPEARLYHYGSPVARTPKKERKVMEIRNHYFVFKKNFRRSLWREGLFFYSVLGEFLLCLVSFLANPSREKYVLVAGVIEGVCSLPCKKN